MKIVILMLLLVSTAAADVFISQAVPAEDFIELYNDGDESVNVSGWVLMTEKAPVDATLDGTILPHDYFLIGDPGSGADHEEVITLYKKDSGIALVADEVVDALGWGDSANIDEGLWTGTPANNPENALLRINNTGDNSFDFIDSAPVFGSGISIDILVTSDILEWSILPGATRIIRLNGSIRWLNNSYENEVELHYTTAPGLYDIEVDDVLRKVRVLPTKAIRPKNGLFVSGLAGETASTMIEIENIGNVDAVPAIEHASIDIIDEGALYVDTVEIPVGTSREVKVSVQLPSQEGHYRGRVLFGTE